MSRRVILSIALLLLVATVVLYYPKAVDAFLPDDKTRNWAVDADVPNIRSSKTHEAITKAGLVFVAQEFFGISRLNITQEMRAANNEISAANARVDLPQILGGDQFNKSASHFDGENFPGSMSRIVDYKFKVRDNLNANNVTQARFFLGQALHTIQDFYSHSNWIERGETSHWSALGNPAQVIRTFPPMSRNTCTNCRRDLCSDCIEPGTILPLTTNELTTSYYGGDDREKENRLKCSHGGKISFRRPVFLVVPVTFGPFRDSSGRGDLSNGINKDTTSCEASPHRDQHIEAAEVAYAATVDYLRQIRTLVGLEKMRKLLGVGRTMAFAVDTTGSMIFELDAIKDKIVQIVDSRRGTPLEPSLYILSPFSDPETGPLTVTDDVDTFKNALNNLTAGFGGDCPERAYKGIYEALRQSSDSGDLIMFTDAAATQSDRSRYMNGVLRLARQKHVRVNIVYSGSFGDCETDPTYARVARETGGLYFEIQPEELFDAASLSELIFRPQLGMIFSARGPLSGFPLTFPFRIDSLLTQPSFVISGTGATNIVVRRPDGSVVLSTDPGVTYVALSTGAFYSFINPPVGTWTITINGSESGLLSAPNLKTPAISFGSGTSKSGSGTTDPQKGSSSSPNGNSNDKNRKSSRNLISLLSTTDSIQTSALNSSGEFAINVYADTNVQLSSFEFLDPAFESAHGAGVFPTPGGPIAGQPSDVSATVSGNDNPTPTFQFRALDGTILQSFTLEEVEPGVLDPEFAEPTRKFLGEITVPQVPFQVYLTGTEPNGTAYQRLISSVFIPQKVKFTAKSTEDLHPGLSTSFVYSITNYGPAGTFHVQASDDQEFVQEIGMDTLTLATNETKEFTVSLAVPLSATPGALETVYLSSRRTEETDLSADGSFGPYPVHAKPVLNPGTVTAVPTAGPDAVIDPGEGGTLSVQLVNSGTGQATDVHATLRALTPGIIIAAGESTYPNIAVGNGATNSTPFVFYVPSDAPCGQTLEFAVLVTATSGDTTTQTEHTISVQTGTPSTGSTTTTSYTGPAVAIPENDAFGVNIPLTVSGITGVVNDLNFRIDGSTCSNLAGSQTVGLDHTFVADLVLKLTSPAGTTVNLINRAGGGGRNFCNTLLDDEASTSIQSVTSGSAPFTGTFKPAGLLAAFDGENPNGTWILNVSDREALDTGNVRAFSLIVSPVQHSCAGLPADTTPPSLSEGSYNPGPPASGQIIVQDTGSGLARIDVTAVDNVEVQLPSFNAATTNAQVVTGTLINPTINGSFEVEATDLAGNVSFLSRTVLSAPAAPPKILFRTDRHGAFVNYELYVMNEDGSNLTRITNSPSTTGNYQPKWSPNGQKIAYAAEMNGLWDIIVANPDGTNPVNLTQHNAFESYFAFAPDSSKIVFESHRDGPFALWRINVDGTGLTKLINNGGPEQPPAWSPDGQKIAFLSFINSVNNKTDVWVMNQDGTNPVNLTQSSAQETQPRWSPDGTKILFARRSTNTSPYDIYVMNADGSNVQRLTTNSTSAAFEWSPDGSKIVFQSNRDGNLEIYVMNADGSNQVRLTNSAGSDFAPKWNSDGSRILFISFRTGNSEIFIMNANGTGQVNLTNNAAADDSATWQP